MKTWVSNLSVVIFMIICLSISSGFNNKVIGQTEKNDKGILINKAFTGAWEGLAKNAKLKLCVKGGRLEGSISQGSVIENGVIDSQSTISENELFVFVKDDKDRTTKIHLKLLGNRQLQIGSENKNSLMARKTNHNKSCYAPIANNKAVTVVQGGVVTSDSGSSTGGTTTVVQGGVITSGPGAVTPTPAPVATSTPVATPKPATTSTTGTPAPKPPVAGAPSTVPTTPKPPTTTPKPPTTGIDISKFPPAPTTPKPPVAGAPSTAPTTTSAPKPPTVVVPPSPSTTAPTTTSAPKPPTVVAPSTGGSNK